MDKIFFENVFIFLMAEPHAMGIGGRISFMNEMGEFRCFDYLTAETPYEEIKEAFPALQGCKWNGPMPGDETKDEIVLFIGENNLNMQTRVNEGWHHMYLGFGNHLVVREDKWPEFCKSISDLSNGLAIYRAWKERAEICVQDNKQGRVYV